MKRHLLLLLAALMLLPPQGRAGDKPAPQIIRLFYNPLGNAFPPATADSGSSSPDAPRYPYIPNRLAACLPGKMKDVSAFFKEAGAFTDAADFAWLNPESNLIIVSAGEADLALVDQVFDAVSSDPPFNVVLTASVSAGADADGKSPKADLLRSSLTTKSGQRSVINAAGKNGNNYSLEIEPVINASGDFADINVAFKTTCLGRDYAVTTSLALAKDKPETLTLGTTADGKDIYFHLAFRIEPVYAGTPAKDRSKDPALLRQIEKALAAPK